MDGWKGHDMSIEDMLAELVALPEMTLELSSKDGVYAGDLKWKGSLVVRTTGPSLKIVLESPPVSYSSGNG